VNIPTAKPTKRQAKKIAEVRVTLGNFAQMFELSVRAGRVGLNACTLIGCTKFNAPTAETITAEQLDLIRKAVEEAEQAISEANDATV